MLEFLTDGGIFGAFLSVVQDSGNFIIFCEKECTIIFIDAIHITKRCSRACRHHSLVVENLLNLMTKKVQQLSEKVEILSHRSIREKLMCYFRMQSGKLETTTFTIPFSFSALANYICVDRSAMTRELRKMRNDGLLELNGRTVSLLTSIWKRLSAAKWKRAGVLASEGIGFFGIKKNILQTRQWNGNCRIQFCAYGTRPERNINLEEARAVLEESALLFAVSIFITIL